MYYIYLTQSEIEIDVKLLQIINEELESQYDLWGGPDHDDQHTGNDWVSYIVRQLGTASRTYESQHYDMYRLALLKVIALGISAYRSCERLEATLVPHG